MRRRVIAGAAVGLALLTAACTTQVDGTAAPAAPSPAGELPGGAEPACLTTCDGDVPADDPRADALPRVTSLPGGLLCRNLASLGYGPSDAVEYWYLWAEPDQMDADLNGIPCETVWPGMDRYMPG